MTYNNWIVYDIEIEKAIPPKRGTDRLSNIRYCEGWHDHANMGISVVGVYDYLNERYRVICADNKEEMERLINRAYSVITFNGEAFDHKVLSATWDIEVPVERSYDLLCEVWQAAGLSRTYDHATHKGYTLDAIAKVNLGEGKTGHGAIAPIDWQQGKIGSVIDYCLMDVRLTKGLIDLIEKNGELIDPVTNARLKMRHP